MSFEKGYTPWNKDKLVKRSTIKKIPTLCACGCNKVVWNGNEYIRGHSTRINNPSKHDDVRQKISEAAKRRKLSEETKHKISEAGKGKTPWNKGKIGCFSESVLKKMSLKSKKRKRTEETNRKISGALKGHIHSEETKRKISEANKGKVASEETRQRQSERLMGNTFSKGIKHSEDTKKKQSESRIGDKNHNWRGGISFEPYCFKFNKALKEKIRKRDNHQCQMPGCLCTQLESLQLYSKILTVHHIHYLKSDCEPDLITLCTRCNFKVNYNRDYYESFFMQKLKDRGLIE